MTDALRVNIRQTTEELVGVEFDLEHRHGGLHLAEVARCTVDGLRDILEDQIEVHFIFLFAIIRCPSATIDPATQQRRPSHSSTTTPEKEKKKMSSYF